MTSLSRRLTMWDAVVVGAGSMVGAGVFTVWSPAAGAAGTALLVGLAAAGLVAFCNATSSAQLAVLYPTSGGTYVYAGRRLGPAWGHLAGWGFVVGKTASCTAMALTVGAYLWPGQERAVAVAAVVGIVVVNLGGITRTVALTRILLGAALLALVVVVVAGWSSEAADIDRLTPIDAGPFEVLRSAGFLFFAFAGYARIATLGEEVIAPEVNIPRAIPLALGAVLGLYAIVAVTALATVGAAALAATDAPLRLVVEAGPLDGLAPVVRVGAGIAALGVLLNLVAGVSRTVLAMARRHELPGWLAAVDRRRSVPQRAEVVVGAVIVVLVLAIDLRGAIAFSGVTVLAYYALTNASALTLGRAQRRWPLALAVVGLVGCLALAVSLPLAAVIWGLVVLTLGVGLRAIVRLRASCCT